MPAQTINLVFTDVVNTSWNEGFTYCSNDNNVCLQHHVKRMCIDPKKTILNCK